MFLIYYYKSSVPLTCLHPITRCLLYISSCYCRTRNERRDIFISGCFDSPLLKTLQRLFSIFKDNARANNGLLFWSPGMPRSWFPEQVQSQALIICQRAYLPNQQQWGLRAEREWQMPITSGLRMDQTANTAGRICHGVSVHHVDDKSGMSMSRKTSQKFLLSWWSNSLLGSFIEFPPWAFPNWAFIHQPIWMLASPPLRLSPFYSF